MNTLTGLFEHNNWANAQLIDAVVSENVAESKVVGLRE